MKITIFGATGDLGRECLQQALEAGHDITVLLRNPDKLPQDLQTQLRVIQGDGLSFVDVDLAIDEDTQAILFAVGVDEKTSPADLCTDITRHILTVMRQHKNQRLIWCGGGSNLLEQDVVSFGARFVRWYAQIFLNHRHTDKVHQLDLLQDSTDLAWFGIRPLQMKAGPKRSQYRLAYEAFSGFSTISFADCADAMLTMLDDDTWLHQAPIVQY